MGAVLVHADRLTATLHTSPRRLFKNLTSEFNSHLAVHQDQVASRGLDFHAVVHAQPPGHEARRVLDRGEPVVLVIDQLEELVTLREGDGAEAERLIAVLARALAERPEALRIAAWRPRAATEVDATTIPHELDWLRSVPGRGTG